MTTSAPKSQSFILLLTAAFCCAAVSWLVVCALPFLDNTMLQQLLQAFSESAGAPSNPLSTWLDVGGSVNVVCLLAIAAAAMQIGMYLTGVPRVAAGTSLFSCVLLLQWCLVHMLGLTPRPLGCFTALATGLFAGLALRRLTEQQRKLQSNYYELKLKDKQLTDARLMMVSQDEIDRRVLAADLHDQVLNELKQISQRFEHYVQSPQNDDAEQIRKLLNEVVKEIREVMDSLSPSTLEHLGLPAAVEDCLRRGAQRSGFKVRFKNTLEDCDLNRLSKIEQVLLYRLAQESINNVCKHAAATIVRATMNKEDNNVLVMRIVDDGKGLSSSPQKAQSRGLKYMEYRASLIGATVHWSPGDNGRGTAVEIRLSAAEEPIHNGQTVGR